MPAARDDAPDPTRSRSRATMRPTPASRAHTDAHPPAVPAATITSSARARAMSRPNPIPWPGDPVRDANYASDDGARTDAARTSRPPDALRRDARGPRAVAARERGVRDRLAPDAAAARCDRRRREPEPAVRVSGARI